jgi:hypothetical protein
MRLLLSMKTRHSGRMSRGAVVRLILARAILSSGHSSQLVPEASVAPPNRPGRRPRCQIFSRNSVLEWIDQTVGASGWHRYQPGRRYYAGRVMRRSIGAVISGSHRAISGHALPLHGVGKSALCDTGRSGMEYRPCGRVQQGIGLIAARWDGRKLSVTLLD